MIRKSESWRLRRLMSVSAMVSPSRRGLAFTTTVSMSRWISSERSQSGAAHHEPGEQHAPRRAGLRALLRRRLIDRFATAAEDAHHTVNEHHEEHRGDHEVEGAAHESAECRRGEHRRIEEAAGCARRGQPEREQRVAKRHHEGGEDARAPQPLQIDNTGRARCGCAARRDPLHRLCEQGDQRHQRKHRSPRGTPRDADGEKVLERLAHRVRRQERIAEAAADQRAAVEPQVLVSEYVALGLHVGGKAPVAQRGVFPRERGPEQRVGARFARDHARPGLRRGDRLPGAARARPSVARAGARGAAADCSEAKSIRSSRARSQSGARCRPGSRSSGSGC